jgi:hypothetical protein
MDTLRLQHQEHSQDYADNFVFSQSISDISLLLTSLNLFVSYSTRSLFCAHSIVDVALYIFTSPSQEDRTYDLGT